MITLATLKDTHRPVKRVQRIGRGMGSKRGKTCGRGTKGDKSRRGYKCRFGHEGGQLPLYRKIPCRGFENGRFRKEVLTIDLSRIDQLYQNGEVVNSETLHQKGYARAKVFELKVLSNGNLKKKVTVEAHSFSKGAKEKLESHSIPYKIISKN